MTELVPPGGWAAAAPPRLHAPPPAQRGWLFRLLSHWARRLGRADVPDVISVLHLNRRLFWPWLWFASRLMPRGRLPATVRELVILRTGWNCRSRYEWGQHVQIGLQVGLSDQQILRVTRGPEAFAGTPLEPVIRACDELCTGRAIADATWQQLRGQYSERLLIELMLLIGHYVMIAGFLNSSGLVLEPPLERCLQEFHQRTARGAA